MEDETAELTFTVANGPMLYLSSMRFQILPDPGFPAQYEVLKLGTISAWAPARILFLGQALFLPEGHKDFIARAF